MNMVDHTINKFSELKVAYTFDAGPHAFLFVHEDNLLSVFKYFWNTLNIEK
jgi:mevalonate pyrophosphate decarboxylase